MKKRILFYLSAFLLLISFEHAGAITYTWTGASATTNTWNDKDNWGGTAFPTTGDDAIITDVSKRQPTVTTARTVNSLIIGGNVTLTLVSSLTITTSLTINASQTLTLSGSGQILKAGNVSFGVPNSTLTVLANSTLNCVGTLAMGNVSVINNSGTITAATVSPSSNGNTINNMAGSTFTVTGAFTMQTGANLTNAGTFSVGSTTTLTSSSNCAFKNLSTGKFTASGDFSVGAGWTITNDGNFLVKGKMTLTSSSSITNSATGIFSSTGDITIQSGCSIANSGIFTSITGNWTFPNNSGSITNNAGGTFSMYNNDVITFGFNCFINNAGTFNAGLSGQICTLNLSTNSSSITNSGTFNLGSTSIINTVSGASVTNTGTFIIHSDINGSGIIGPVTGTSPFSGTYNVERYISAVRGYRLLSSPVGLSTASPELFAINYIQNSCFITGSGGATNGFDTAPGNPNNPSLYLFREDLAGTNKTFTSGNYRAITKINYSPSYRYLVGTDGGPYSILSGNGFLFFYRGDRNVPTPGQLVSAQGATYKPTTATLTATGALKTGPVVFRHWHTALPALLNTTTSADPSVRGFNLLGNPYASSINWDTYSITSSTSGIYAPGVAPFLYILMPNGNYNVYKANTAGGVSTGGIANSNIIPSGQGFFVQATGANSALTFNEAAKTNAQVVSGTGGNLFLGAPQQAAVNRYLHIMLLQDTAKQDGILINFDSSAKPQYIPNEDAPYLPGNGSAGMCSLSADSIPLSINTLPLPKLTASTIPLNISAVANGAYKLNPDDLKSIPGLYDIWLMDAYTKDSVNFRTSPTYSFNVILSDAASYGAGRFSLVIRQNPALGVRLLNFTAVKVTQGSQIVWATSNEQNYTNFTLERSIDEGKTFDVLNGFLSTAAGTYSFLDKEPQVPSDQYRLKIEDLNGTVSYSNVVTLMYANLNNNISGNISIYPNPASSIINLSINQNNGFSNVLSPGLPALQVTGFFPVLTSVLSGTQSYEIKIISITGNVIKTATTTQQSWQENVAGLTPGTYIVQVVNNNDKSLVGKSTFIKL